jgi:radical SAM protein (TIGR01212 family)
MTERYNSLAGYFRKKYGKIVRKITVSLDFTCPNIDGTKGTGGCIYCVNGSMPPLSSRTPSLREQLENGMDIGRKRYGNDIYFMAYFQTNSNTYAPVNKLREIYDTVLEYPGIKVLEVGTRPDCVGEDVIELLKSYLGRLDEVWLELGLQSSNDDTLKKINRGHTVGDFISAVQRAKDAGLKTSSHLIMGFPWETNADMLASVGLLCSLGVDAVKLHPLFISRGTVLARMYEEKNFYLMSMPDFVHVLADSVEIMPPDMILQRFTAEGDEKLLVGPDYCRMEYKNRIKDALIAELKKRGSTQGIKYIRPKTDIKG